jgi:hypothetical protein
MRQTLDDRYKTRIPWRELLQIDKNDGIPHGRRDLNSQSKSHQRKLKATKKALSIKHQIKKIQSNPWSKTDERFFSNILFLKQTKSEENVSLPIISSINAQRSLKLSIVNERNYNSDITNPRYLKGRLETRTSRSLGPGSYLLNGPRSAKYRINSVNSSMLNRHNGKLRKSASFTNVPRPRNIFQHMKTFENEVDDIRNIMEEKRLNVIKRKKKKMEFHKKKSDEDGGDEDGGDEDGGDEDGGDEDGNDDEENVMSSHGKGKNRNKRKKILPSTILPLKRAYNWYTKYGSNQRIKKMYVDPMEEEKVVGTKNGKEESFERRRKRIQFEKLLIPASVAYLKERENMSYIGSSSSSGNIVGSKKNSDKKNNEMKIKDESTISSSCRLFSRDLM